MGTRRRDLAARISAPSFRKARLTGTGAFLLSIILDAIHCSVHDVVHYSPILPRTSANRVINDKTNFDNLMDTDLTSRRDDLTPSPDTSGLRSSAGATGTPRGIRPNHLGLINRRNIAVFTPQSVVARCGPAVSSRCPQAASKAAPGWGKRNPFSALLAEDSRVCRARFAASIVRWT